MSNSSLLIGWRKQWHHALRRFLRRRVRTAVDIDDLAQETYLRLLRVADLREVRNPQAYLLRIASHVIAEWRDRQLPADQCTEVDEDVLIDEHTPDFQLDMQLCRERLNEALESVSPTMRAALLLRLRDERPYREIAQELKLTDRQVRRYLGRGFEQLRRAVEDPAEGPMS